MNTRSIQRFNAGYILLILFTFFFTMFMPVFFGILISDFKLSISKPVGVILIIIYIFLLFFELYLFADGIPKKYEEKLVHRFLENEFKNAFYYKYREDHCLIDEVNGRIGIVTRSNPLKFQILDAALIQKIDIVPPSYQRTQPLFYEYGLALWTGGKKYIIYTYNGFSGGRMTTSIDIKSKTAQDALKMADQLEQHIQHAKEVSIRKHGSVESYLSL